MYDSLGRRKPGCKSNASSRDQIARSSTVPTFGAGRRSAPRSRVLCDRVLGGWAERLWCIEKKEHRPGNESLCTLSAPADEDILENQAIDSTLEKCL